jgi:hypothetical protein
MTERDRWPWGGQLHASFVRIAVLTIWCATACATPYQTYALFPSGMIKGYGLGRLLLGSAGAQSVVMSYAALVALRSLTILGCLLAMLAPRRRWIIVGLVGIVLVLDLVTKAIGGYANHAQFSPLLALLIFAVFSARPYLSLGEIWATLAERRRSPPPAVLPTESSPDAAFASVVWLVALSVVIPYTYIGVNRLQEGGIGIFTGDALPNYIRFACGYAPNEACVRFGALLGVPWVVVGLKTGFVLTTCFEVGSALALVSLRFRVVWLVVIVAFHLLTLISMNIFFWENLTLVLAVFGWEMVRRL